MRMLTALILISNTIIITSQSNHNHKMIHSVGKLCLKNLGYYHHKSHLGIAATWMIADDFFGTQVETMIYTVSCLLYQ